MFVFNKPHNPRHHPHFIVRSAVQFLDDAVGSLGSRWGGLFTFVATGKEKKKRNLRNDSYSKRRLAPVLKSVSVIHTLSFPALFSGGLWRFAGGERRTLFRRRRPPIAR